MNINSTNSIPNSILTKLYDFTGTSCGGNRGFILLFISPEGIPVITSKVENPCIGLALKKTMEMFLEESDPSEA